MRKETTMKMLSKDELDALARVLRETLGAENVPESVFAQAALAAKVAEERDRMAEENKALLGKLAEHGVLLRQKEDAERREKESVAEREKLWAVVEAAEQATNDRMEYEPVAARRRLKAALRKLKGADREDES